MISIHTYNQLKSLEIEIQIIGLGLSILSRYINEYYIAAYSYSYPYGFRLGLWSAIPEEIKNSDIMEKKEAKRKYFS